MSVSSFHFFTCFFVPFSGKAIPEGEERANLLTHSYLAYGLIGFENCRCGALWEELQTAPVVEQILSEFGEPSVLAPPSYQTLQTQNVCITHAFNLTCAYTLS